MKLSNLSKVVSAGAIAASLAVLPLAIPAQAQTQNTAPDTTYNQRTGAVDVIETNDDFDWGWLGLLGLGGLAGLIPKKRQEPVHTRPINDPDLGVRPGTDYRR